LPRRFGDYELLEELARGGMGVVFKARQISLDRIVALKLLLGGALVAPEYIKRFRLEAAAAGGLQHPNIVAIHEVGLHEGQHFIAMDYVAGPNLGKVVATQPLPARQAATYLKAIAQAIDYAHSRGILHRDLKPSNILLDANDQPRVTDFGLAKKLESDVDLTVTGQVLGSPNYMPPEQATGQRGNLDRTADVYSLGAILYHLLTGRPPFHADTLATTLDHVRTAEPVSPRRLNASLPRDLETICLKCLEKEPARRYPAAQSLAEDLDRFLNREPILARPIGFLGRTWRWCRRKPALASASALATMLLLTLAVGAPIVASQQRAAAEEYRKLLYASDLKVALQAWQQAQLQQAVTALDRHLPQPGQRDLREFTWHYLNRLCRPYRQTRTLKTPNAVLALAATQNGKLLAAAGGMDYVTIWDLEADTDRPFREFTTGEPYLAGPLTFSPDGRYFLAGGLSKKRSRKGLQVWDALALRETGRLDLVFGDPGLPGRHCDFSPDGKLLAVPSGNEVVIKRAGGDWEEIKRLTHHEDSAWSARFSSDGTRLVTTSFDKTAVLWDTITWERIAVLSHTNGVLLAVFSPDDQQVVTASGNTVRLWDLNSQLEVNSYSHAGFVTGLDFSPDGRLVASGAYDGLVKVWDWKADTIRTLRGHSQLVSPVKFVLGGTRLASGSWDHTVRIWDLDPPPPNDLLEGRGGEISPLAFALDGRLIATVSASATNILLWRPATGALETSLPAPALGALLSPEEIAGAHKVRIVRMAVNELAFSRNGALAAARGVTLNLAGTNSWQERIELWDVRRRVLTNSFAGQMPICFSPDSRWFACQNATSGAIQFHDLETGREWTSQGSFEATPDKNEFAFSPDGRLLASSGAETVLWETATGRRLATLASTSRDREEPIRTVAFTPDGQWLIAAGISAEIEIWELTTPRRIHSTASHMGEITSLAISPDGRTLATGNQVGVIKLWRLQAPERRYRSRWETRELLTLTEHQGAISHLRFSRSPDGDMLGSSDNAGVVRLWRADSAPSQSQDRKPLQKRETGR